MVFKSQSDHFLAVKEKKEKRLNSYDPHSQKDGRREGKKEETTRAGKWRVRRSMQKKGNKKRREGAVAGGGVGGYRSESVQNGLGAGERELVSVQNRVFRIALHSTVKGDPTSVRHLQELS